MTNLMVINSGGAWKDSISRIVRDDVVTRLTEATPMRSWILATSAPVPIRI